MLPVIGSAQQGPKNATEVSADQSIALPAERAAENLTNKVSPTYPPLAKATRIQGNVRLAVVISKTGDVDSVKVVSGHPLLVPSAVEAVKKWQYKPFLVNGQPVAVKTDIEVPFSLGVPDADLKNCKNVSTWQSEGKDSVRRVDQAHRRWERSKLMRLFTMLVVLVFLAGLAVAQSSQADDLLYNQVGVLKGKVTIYNDPDLGQIPAGGSYFVFQRLGCHKCLVGVRAGVSGEYELFLGEGKYRVVMRDGNREGEGTDMIREGQVRDLTVVGGKTTAFDFQIRSNRTNK
jgi:TonB family protein